MTFVEKFLLPEDIILKVTNDHGVEVEDVFPELAAKEICFVIYTDDDRALNHLFVCKEKLWNYLLNSETTVCCMSTYVPADKIDR